MDADIETLRRLEETVLSLAKLMVDNEDAVRLEVITQPNETLLRLHTVPADVGELVGKQGRTARSFRVILSAIAKKYGHRISLDIVNIQLEG